MGIRQSLNESRPLALLATALILSASLVLIFWYWHVAPAASFANRQFFTDDDGATWFIDDGTRIAPFDHNGKQAVIARVFKCKDGTMFVGYLEKFSDDAKARIESARQQGPSAHGGAYAMPAGQFNGLMLKKPRGAEWVRDIDPEAKAVKQFSCPDGSKDFEPVIP